MVYMNTNVTRGAGEFVVTATGMATEVGHISGMLQAEQAVKTPLTRQLDKLTHQILWIAGVALVVSMALNLARGDTFRWSSPPRSLSRSAPCRKTCPPWSPRSWPTGPRRWPRRARS